MNNVLILAGGLGTRLLPLKLGVSKPLAPIRGRSFIEWQILHLSKFGFRKFTLAISQNTLDIKRSIHFPKKFGIHLDFSIDPAPIGTGTAVLRALPFMSDEFFILNGDTMFSFDPRLLLNLHYTSNALATLAVVKKNNNGRFTSVTFNSSGKIKALSAKKTKKNGNVSSGVVVVDKAIFKGYKLKKPYSLERDILEKVASSGRMFALPMLGTFWDIGTPRSYQYFKAHYKI